MKTSFLVMLLLVSGMSVAAQAKDGQERAQFDDYYTVAEPQRLQSEENQSENSEAIQVYHSQEMTDLFWAQVDEAVAMGAKVYSLLSFDHHNETFGNVVEPYNRLKHFGTWITYPGETCGNTRAAVLKRDSLTETTNRPGGCSVEGGKWDDPYTGRTYTSANDLQIDHFVPLKNAYVSGADKWNKKKRCLYGNYMGNDFHLLAVFSKENTRKSDRSPEGYMPPNTAYQCQYLAQWLKVKMIWTLGLTPPEKAAIENLAKQNHCTATDLAYTQGELQKQRKFISDNANLCM